MLYSYGADNNMFWKTVRMYSVSQKKVAPPP